MSIFLGISNFLLTPILWLIQIIVLWLPMWICDTLWQIFSWMSLDNVVNEAFQFSTAHGGDGIFGFNGGGTLTTVFLIMGILGFIILFFSIMFHYLALMFQNRDIENRDSPRNVYKRAGVFFALKWIFVFIFGLLATPISLFIMSYFVNLLNQAIYQVLTNNPNNNFFAKTFIITQNNINFLNHQVLSILGTDVDRLGNQDYWQNMNNDLNDLKSILKDIDASKTSDSVRQSIEKANQLINQIQNNPLNGEWFKKVDNISITIKKLVDNYKSENFNEFLKQQVNLQANLDFLTNPETGIYTLFKYLNIIISDLKNNGIINVDNSSDQFEKWNHYMLNFTTFGMGDSDRTNFIFALFQPSIWCSNDKQLMIPNIMENELPVSLSAVPGLKIGNNIQDITTSSFLGNQIVFNFVNGTTDTEIQWNSPEALGSTFTHIGDPYYWARMFCGAIAMIALAVILVLIILALVKRLVELAIYYIFALLILGFSPIDNGNRFYTWLKHAIGKVFSIIVITASVNIFILLLPIFTRITDTMNTSNTTNSSAFDIKQFINIIWIVGTLLGSYFASQKFSQYFGDKSSVHETWSELAVMGSAGRLAAKGAKIGAGIATSGSGLTSMGAKAVSRRIRSSKAARISQAVKSNLSRMKYDNKTPDSAKGWTGSYGGPSSGFNTPFIDPEAMKYDNRASWLAPQPSPKAKESLFNKNSSEATAPTSKQTRFSRAKERIKSFSKTVKKHYDRGRYPTRKSS